LALDAAAEHAAARGATAAAAEFYELAGSVTADSAALARRRRLQAARFHRLAGDGPRARVILDGLLTVAPPGSERADVLFEIASGFPDEPSTVIELFDQALSEAEGDQPRSARILAFRSLMRFAQADTEGALRDARNALDNAEMVGDPALLALVIARLGQAEMWAGEVTPGVLERGAELEERYGLRCDWLTSPRVALSRLLIRRGELERSRAMLDRLGSEAGARGDEITRVAARWYVSMLEWFAGNLHRALEHASEAFELGEQSDFPDSRAWGGRHKALVECDLGLVEQARISAQDGLAYSETKSGEVFAILCSGVLGRLELVLGNVQEAAAHLGELPERLLSAGLNDPTNPVWADAIETLIAVGDVERARAYLEPYEFHAARLPSPWAAVAAARCRGLLAGAQGALDVAFTAFERALTQLDQTPFPLERGRTLLGLGAMRRQASQKRAAREELEQAAALFTDLGAQLWAEKARAELARVSGRRGAGDELTETEVRVAELAAAGRSNKEIAGELFMSVSTVEAHLSHVYRKLGIRSRSGLGSRLATPVDALVNRVDKAAQS
jgi:ATP/maltotriose-dependent transcriptional regulator MalT